MGSRRNGAPAVSWRDLLFYLGATTLFTWPLAWDPVGRLFAPVGAGDPYLNLWILGWDLRTILADPLALLSGRIFSANIFFPAEQTLAYSDHLILQALALTPLYALTRDVVLCYNVLLFASLLASAAAMHLYVRQVTGSQWGARLAGIAWGFWPYRFAHLLHLQLQSLYFLPLVFLWLHWLVASRRRREAAGLGVVAALQAISSVYYGVIAAVAALAGAVTLAIGVGRWRSARFWRRVALAALVGAVLIAPGVVPYWQVQRREGFARNLYEASRHAAVPASYATVPPGNLVYGVTGWLRGPSGESAGARVGPEVELFPGAVVVALAAFGLWRARRLDCAPVAASLLAVAATGAVLSFGPDGVRPLYAALHRLVFGFQAIRAPARFGILVMFGLAGLAALGVRALTMPRLVEDGEGTSDSRRPARRAAAGLLLVCLAGLEYLNVPLPSVPAPPRQTPVGQWLAAAPEPGAVLSLPLAADAANTAAMVQSLEHGRPLVNGYSGQRPSFFLALVDAMAAPESADALWTLRDLNVRFVVSPRTLAPAAGSTPLVLRARFGTDHIYELRWTPEIEAALPRPQVPAPPEPGPLPFVAAEAAVYRVGWLGVASALTVAAGHAVVTAERIGAGSATAGEGGAPAEAAFRLAVTAETAAWVSRFFEARDRFETWTDQRLLPLVHRQELREGRRQVDRTVTFDHVRRIATGGDNVPLPMPEGTRDSLSAFLYVRTLDLPPGARVRLPVIESGRMLSVDLLVVGEEPVTVGGRTVEALRVEPTLTYRTVRRRPLQITLWLSRDVRRVPLAFEVTAGFGSFRGELDSYAQR